MAQKNNVRSLVLRGVLCFLALPGIVSVFTSKASLQNTNAANTVRVSNANISPKKTPPRNSTNRPVNALMNSSNVYVPAPTPTPPANSTIRGRVFYADTGRAVKRAMLILMKEDGSGGPGDSPSAVTDGEGNFQIRNVRAGVYYSTVNAPGIVSPFAYADFSKQNEREALKSAFAGFEKIVVNGINDLDVQISAQRGGAIGGRVSYDDGDAAIGVKVEILRKTGDKFLGIIPNLSAIVSMMSGGAYQTDDRGVYRFAGLPPGDYIVKVTENTSHGENKERRYYDPFEAMLGGNSFLTYFYPDALESKSAQVLNIQFGQEMTEINLVIPTRNLFKLEGKILNRRDKTPVKARINIIREGTDDTYSIFNQMGRRRTDTILTDENGGWKFKDLPKGNYKLVIEPVENNNTYDSDDYPNSNISNVSRNIPPKPKLAKKTEAVVIEDQDIQEMVIELGYGATVAGTAAVENSQEMPRSVTIRAALDGDESGASGYIGNSGDFEGVPPSSFKHDFKIENVPEGKAYLTVAVDDEDYYVKSATLGGADLLGNPFEVKEGESLRNVQIMLAKDVGTLRGLVLNDEKEPVKALSFLLVPIDSAKRKNSSYFRAAVTNENGEFETKVPPGEYAVVFNAQSLVGKSREEIARWLDAAVKEAQTIKIEAGQTGSVTVLKKK